MAGASCAIRGTFLDFIDDPWKHVGHEQDAARFIRRRVLFGMRMERLPPPLRCWPARSCAAGGVSPSGTAYFLADTFPRCHRTQAVPTPH